MTEIRSVVEHVVSGAASWGPSGFAIFASREEPSWYVQFTRTDDGQRMLIEASDPRYSSGKSLTAGQISSVRALGFAETEINYQQIVGFTSDTDSEHVISLIDRALVQVFGLEAPSAVDVRVEPETFGTASEPTTRRASADVVIIEEVSLRDGRLTVLQPRTLITLQGESRCWASGFNLVNAPQETDIAVAYRRFVEPFGLLGPIAGTHYRPDALADERFEPGSRIELRAEPKNRHDPNAVSLWDEYGQIQIGFVPRAHSEFVAQALLDGRRLQGMVLLEFAWTATGERAGLWMLIADVGTLTRLRSTLDAS
jgi:hypothetical protein